jgi:transcriptional regulator with XRE-family HTH domain
MLGENLYFYRRKRGLSRRALSELSGGIHPATIAAIENNRSISPRGDKIGKLAKALGLTVKLLTDPRRPELRSEDDDVVLRVSKPEGVEFTDRDLHLIHNILKSVIEEVANSKRKLRESSAIVKPLPKKPSVKKVNKK